MVNKADLVDALIAHNVNLHRLSTHAVFELVRQFNGISNKKLSVLIELLNELSESELIALSGGQYTTPALKEVRGLLSEWFSTIKLSMPETFAISATALAMYEAKYVSHMFGEKTKVPDGKVLFQKAKKVPFSGGMLIDELFTKVAGNLRQKTEYAIRDGINSGKTTQQIVQAIKGTKKNDYRDGILERSRQEISALVRTARSHIANQAQNTMYEEMGVEWLKVMATLDGRTCLFCAGQDGRVYRSDDPNRPNFPVHPHNRTIYVPVADKDGQTIGNRPFVADERSVKNIPTDERAGKVGQVDSNTTYKDWFARQDANFQRSILGKTRYELYKSGKLSIDKFTADNSSVLTIDELRTLDQKAFKELGL
ncbi:minor capsid protein [Acinetobacter haemolyticus]|uniref:minor capsid protein n=1 Tax=Acinetobacter haemolyticus TaxID=29430 RepID=UPI000E591233|nr:minor capsid protein [Acinetobacter haemolyticus]QDJ92699.1 phage head morphogenesis protein [Acinetobacter haemolyticus]